MASGALDAVAMSLSIAWQYGVPFEQSMSKFVNMRFEPEGMTGNPDFPIVTSPLDYIARLALARHGLRDNMPEIAPPPTTTLPIAESPLADIAPSTPPAVQSSHPEIQESTKKKTNNG
jgi:hypothetical protein